MLCSGVSLGRVTPRATISLLLVCVGIIVYADFVASSTGIGKEFQDESTKMNQDDIDEEFRMQCPNAEDIDPCRCKLYWSSQTWDIDCSYVESEEQLRQVFESHFPFKNFTSFTMVYNNHLKVFESGVLGDVTFETFYVENNAIEVVETDAFTNCYETLTRLSFGYNEINSFPFNDIPKFSRLNMIEISSNKFNTVPLEVFHGSTTLAEIAIHENTGSFTGNFQDIPNLRELHLPVNNFPNISANYFKTGSKNIEVISLNHCNISSVEPDAFDSVHGLVIRLYGNLLATLDEATWRPLFEAGVGIDARENPLECGCDVAWLFDDDHLVDQVLDPYGGGRPTCNDGTPIHDLDPAIFDNC